jgi:hypothetical protein
MNIKSVFSLLFMTLIISSCNDKRPEYGVDYTPYEPPTYEPTSTVDTFLAKLKMPKKGFECELEELISGNKSQVFYIDKTERKPDVSLYHQLYTVLPDGKNVSPNIVIEKREIFYSVSYTSELDEIFTATGLTLSSSPQKETIDGVKVFDAGLNISFDSKINEFFISLVTKSIDENIGVTTSTEASYARITNCFETKKIIPLGFY